MRIGMMLRAIDEQGGIGVYTRNLVKELLTIDGDNEYILFYQSTNRMGCYKDYDNVTELLVRGSNKAYWDQIAIPYACAKEKVDLVFHPKFTVPLFAPCKAIMVVHGADWFMPEQSKFYPWWDVQYIRTVMPLYFKKASVVISVSELTTQNFNQVLNLPPGKVKTVYFGPARNFRPISDQSILDKVSNTYRLPDKFIFTLTKLRGGTRKNLNQLLSGYALYHQKTDSPIKLVIGGKDCHLFRQEYGMPEDGYGGDIIFPGWIDQEDLPSVYSLADTFLYPSNLEAFPIPVTEAMACGTPIITSNVNGLKEIAGDAALYVDPKDPTAISESIYQMLGNDDLRSSLSAKGRERAENFNWETCARKTLSIIEGLASDA